LGDVNGDGVKDFMVSSPNATVGSTPNVGVVKVYSGKDQSELYTYEGEIDETLFGETLVSAGDVNQDGYADFIIGHPNSKYGSRKNAGKVWVYSGRYGSRTYYFCPSSGVDYGSKVGGLDDIDSDGIDDFAIADARPGGGGRIDVHSGETGRLVYIISGKSDDTHFGRDFAQIGEVNNDGIDDIIVTSSVGWMLYSGADGSFLRSHATNGSDPNLWYGVATCDDLNGDGTADFVISTPRSAASTNPTVTSFDGATLQEIFTFEGTANDADMYSVANLGDFDRTGYSAFLIGNHSLNNADIGTVSAIGYDPYLKSGVDHISAEKGGNVVFRIDFPDDCADLDFRMLISASGDGPSQFGVAVPLTPDSLTKESLAGRYPVNTHYNMHGTLDSEGNAWSSFAFPKNMPSAMIGHCFRFAVVAAPTASLPVISSARQTIDILP